MYHHFGKNFSRGFKQSFTNQMRFQKMQPTFAFSTVNNNLYQFKLVQAQAAKLTAANMLMRSITINQLITNEEAEMGLVASEDQEEDDG
jgi:hypothetical protein